MKKQNILKELIDKMFCIAGYDIGYDDVLKMEGEWYSQYTMTNDQQDEWLKWGVDHLCKTRWASSKKSAKNEMSWINLMYGLKIK